MSILRTVIFNILFCINSFALTGLIVLFRPLGLKFVYPIGRFWGLSNLFMLKVICGITHEVRFKGKLPDGPAVYLSNHQSAWETVAFPTIFPPFMWVLKKELMYVPIFGWSLMALGHIGINRSAGSKSIKQINKEGKRILKSGYSMLIFPEGTRAAPGKLENFNPGGVGLAITNGVPIVPVTHNAGRLWSTQSYGKKPGKVTVIVDEPIPTADVSPSERKALNQQIRDIIGKRLEEIGG